MRYAHIDALRGLALLGICLVNVWYFAYGYQSDHLAIFPAFAGAADWAVMGLVAFIFEGKFYPIFAFLFGAGFWLMRQSARRDGRLESFDALYRRRCHWLLMLGLLHAFLLYAGDILVMYACYGFLLLHLAQRRPRELLRLLRIFLMILLALFILLAPLLAWDRPEQWRTELADSRHAYTIAQAESWLLTTPGRMKHALTALAGLIVALPEVFGYFLLGVLATRLGYLTQPQRHLRFWRRVAVVGLGLGLPLNLLGAWVGIVPMGQLRPAMPWESLLASAWTFLHFILAAGFVAAFMLWGGKLVAWLAPAGRMALTHYLGQSLLGAFLVQASWTRPQVLAYCILLFLAQVALSHWWLKRYPMGPVEAIWRRFTYQNAKIEG